MSSNYEIIISYWWKSGKIEKLREDLALAARTMVRFSCKINFLIGHNRSFGQGITVLSDKAMR
jgi:hypothetical protein